VKKVENLVVLKVVSLVVMKVVLKVEKMEKKV
jgi:hypothetical protein